jgi:hypothetical protein
MGELKKKNHSRIEKWKNVNEELNENGVQRWFPQRRF